MTSQPTQRRPGNGARVSRPEVYTTVFNGRKYEEVRVYHRPGHEAYISPTMEGEPEHGPNLNRTLICKECRITPPNLVEESHSGDMVCGDCGLVLDRVISTDSEWRNFANDDDHKDKSRVGAAENPAFCPAELELQTTIVGSGESAKALERAQRHASGRDHKKLNTFKGAQKDLNALGDQMGLSRQVVEVAMGIYKLHSDSCNTQTLKKKKIDYHSLLGVCLMFGCRQIGSTGHSRSFKEIAKFTKCKVKDLGRAFNSVQEIIKKHAAEAEAAKEKNIYIKNKVEGYNAEANITTAVDLIVRFIQALNIPNHLKLRTMAEHVARVEEKTVGCLAGRRPSTIAGAAIYLVIVLTGTDKSCNEVGTVCGVSDNTLQKAFKIMCKEADKFVNPKWIEDGLVDMSKIVSSKDAKTKSVPVPVLPAQALPAPAMPAA